MYSHILFDADNTLLDFSKAERNAFILTMQEHSLSWDEAMLSRYIEINISLWQELERGLIDKETVLHRRFDMLLEGNTVSSADVNRTFQLYLCGAVRAHAQRAGGVRSTQPAYPAFHRDQRRSHNAAAEDPSLRPPAVFQPPLYFRRSGLPQAGHTLL